MKVNSENDVEDACNNQNNNDAKEEKSQVFIFLFDFPIITHQYVFCVVQSFNVLSP